MELFPEWLRYAKPVDATLIELAGLSSTGGSGAAAGSESIGSNETVTAGG